MKSLLILIGFAIIFYWLYTYYQQNPDSVPQFHRSNLTSTPLPSPAVPTPKPTQPPLDSIPLVKGPTLTHAKVKDFSTTAVVFVCDQGLFQVTYDRLPPGFAAYYIPLVPAPTPTPSPTPTPTPGPTVVPSHLPVVNHPVRSSEEDAAALRNYNGDLERYKVQMAEAQAVMDRYRTQSSFDRDPISQDTYNQAQANYDRAQQAMNDRLSQGP